MSESPLPSPDRSFPGVGHALLLMLLFTFVMGMVQVPALVLEKLGVHTGLWAIHLLAQLGATAAVLLVAQAWSPRPMKERLPLRPVNPWLWPALLVAMAGLILLTGGLDALVARLLPEPAWLKQAFAEMGWPALVLGAPLSEEALFRGVILGGFLGRYAKPKAILLSALLFTLMHLNPWQLLPPFAAGLFCGWLVAESGSLLPALAAHALNNLVFVLADRLPIPGLSGAGLLPPGLWAAGLLLLALGLLGLRRALRPSAAPQGAACGCPGHR